jgi:hypothetical protein
MKLSIRKTCVKDEFIGTDPIKKASKCLNSQNKQGVYVIGNNCRPEYQNTNLHAPRKKNAIAINRAYSAQERA